MSDIKNIKFGALTPDKRMTLHNGTVTEVKRTYKVVDGQAVVVWDIGGKVSGLTMKFDVALSGNIIVIEALETTAHTGKIDWGDGTVQDYTSTSQTGHMYSDTSGTSYTVTISCPFESLSSVHINRGILTEIAIPDGVSSLGESCFSSLYHLTKVSLPDSIIAVGENCFRNCEALTEIKIPRISTIPYCCFYNCQSLQAAEIPDTVTMISNLAFDSCTSLQEIVIPDSVTGIVDGSFYGCSGLISITVPHRVTSI